MKKDVLANAIIVLLLLVAGCNKDESVEYYSVLGTLEYSGDSIIIESDDNERLLVEKSSGLFSNLEESDRVIAYFSIIDKTVPSGIKYIIDVYSISEILLKPVVTITEENADSIGEDPVKINSMWISKNYLNLDFAFYGSSKTHYINLANMGANNAGDTIKLEVRHNDNGDSQAYLLNGFVSFDISTLQNTAKDSITLDIKALEYDNRSYDKSFTYKYK